MKKIKVLWDLFMIFLKIGGFTFGGGLAMLPLIQREVVDNRSWVAEEEIIDIFAISQSVPGVIAINTSIFVGNKVAGKSGAVAAAFGVILPAFVSIILVVTLLIGLQGNIYVEKVFAGIRAASAGLILLAAIKLGRNAVKGRLGYFIAIAAFLAITIWNIHAAWAIVFGGVAGYGLYLFNGGTKHA
ncbi:MAG: chromate transporter [Clostridia bacterium]|nr:chromate transporter [Clostridia bacterium]